MQNIWLNEVHARSVRERYAQVEQAELNSEADTQLGEIQVLLERVEAELLRLPDDQRAILALVYVEGMTYREAAEAE